MNADFWRVVAPGIELRQFQIADAEPTFAMVERHREYLRGWLPWVDQTHSAADIREFICRAQEQINANRGPQAAIWVEGEIRGSVGCHPIDWPNWNCSIGYWVDPALQGRGIVTRSAAAMLNHLFDDLQLHRVEIRCGTGNTRSCAIPQRLGFTREGIARGAEWVGGRWVDLVVWSILDAEWRGRLRNPEPPRP
jgi:ribosomal-protein-serine acetyltransferase